MRITNIDALMDCDLYSIEEDGRGGKEVHVFAYYFTNGESVTDNPDEIFRIVEFSNFDMPVQSFLALVEKNEVDEESSNYKQYWGDLTEEACKKSIMHYFNGNAGSPLLYGDITADTPCGNYINISKEDYDAAFRD